MHVNISTFQVRAARVGAAATAPCTLIHGTHSVHPAPHFPAQGPNVRSQGGFTMRDSHGVQRLADAVSETPPFAHPSQCATGREFNESAAIGVCTGAYMSGRPRPRLLQRGQCCVYWGNTARVPTRAAHGDHLSSRSPPPPLPPAPRLPHVQPATSSTTASPSARASTSRSPSSARRGARARESQGGRSGELRCPRLSLIVAPPTNRGGSHPPHPPA